MDVSPVGCVCVDGQLSTPAEARLPALDHGALFGDGVFETLRAYHGRPFRLDAHLTRLSQAMSALEFPSPPPREQLAAWVEETLQRSGLQSAHLRLTVTRGVGSAGWSPAGCARPTVVVSALPLRLASNPAGVAVVTGGTRGRDEALLAAWKSTSYQRALLLRLQAQRVGAHEALVLDEAGNVLEGCASNVFAVVDGALWTPSSGCLPGITRAEVLTLARASGQPVKEAPLPEAVLASAQEAFLTSSLAELVPVVTLDGKPIGEGRVGPVTRGLQAAYRTEVERACPR